MNNNEYTYNTNKINIQSLIFNIKAKNPLILPIRNDFTDSFVIEIKPQ